MRTKHIYDMILIADSGSTKTDWTLISDSASSTLRTQGINPLFLSKEDIKKILKHKVFEKLTQQPDTIYFYGAGCIGESQQQLTQIFQSIWKDAKIHLFSDLYAAIHALCPQESGLIAILGTGMNSCFWNGKEIEYQIPPLGYILGDEGSGAYIGKLFIKRLLRNELPKPITQDFFSSYQTNYEQLITTIYTTSTASQKLSSYCEFIYKNKTDKNIQEIIQKSFQDFFDRIITLYPKEHSLYFSGSIAFYFQEELLKVANSNNRDIKKIMQSPIKELVAYHTKY